MSRGERPFYGVVLVLVFAAAITSGWWGPALAQDTPPPACTRVSLPVVVNLDDVKHANLIAHERAAIEAGQPRQLTLERDNAEQRRREDLRGIPTRPGFDRDEYPPAFTEEAGTHSDGRPRDDVAYVASSENRSGGSVMGLALRGYCDGQRFVIEAGRL